ncbi:DUF6368 family protein [Streptomyces liangshanensis]|uniref:DUF6368 family protein n=1 Tax=Streptomyces liangshanensis TaxID=2717324 RepID=UPI0036DA8AAB
MARNLRISRASTTAPVELCSPEWAKLPAPATLREFRALMENLSSHFAEKRPGFYDVNVPAERLGVENGQEEERHRPFLVYVMGPGAGDKSLFEAEHADEPEVAALLGFGPTHAVNVSACCNRPIDHVTTALLTAAVMDVVGGVAKADLLDGQASVVAGLPGVSGVTDDGWTVLGTAEFLRAWAAHPAFRLVK